MSSVSTPTSDAAPLVTLAVLVVKTEQEEEAPAVTAVEPTSVANSSGNARIVEKVETATMTDMLPMEKEESESAAQSSKPEAAAGTDEEAKKCSPCDVCAENYTQMQVYYESLAQNRKGLICFDIEDRMNQTRYAWSAIYNCCKGKQHSQTAFIWFASGISSLPVIFYVMMYLITCRKEARERAAAPLLNDQSVVAERDEPQASTSSVPRQLDDTAEENDQYGVEVQPKLNNLDKAQAGVRESKLIDLDSESSKNLDSTQVKSLLIKRDDEDDDVSILRNPNLNIEVDKLLD